MPVRLTLLTISCLVMQVGCHSQSQPAAPPKPAALETIDAEIILVAMKSWPKSIRSQGSLYADERAIVGAKVAGLVKDVHCDVGDLVKVGDPLVTLDQEDFRLQVEQAEAQLTQSRASVGLKVDEPVEKLSAENSPPVREAMALWNEAKASLARVAALQKQNAISQGEYEVAASAERVSEARYASAINSVREKIALIRIRQVELSIARQQLNDAVFRSPLDGFVLSRQVAPGSYLSVGQSVMVIVRSNPLRFRGTVPERYAQSLAIGQEVQLQIESVVEPRMAVITRISPALDQQSRALTFEALLDNQNQSLRAGLFSEAIIQVNPDAQALVVPESAITQFAGAVKAWKVVDGVTKEQEVIVGARRGQQLEIVEGLAVGDVILRDAKKGRIAKIKQ